MHTPHFGHEVHVMQLIWCWAAAKRKHSAQPPWRFLVADLCGKSGSPWLLQSWPCSTMRRHAQRQPKEEGLPRAGGTPPTIPAQPAGHQNITMKKPRWPQCFLACCHLRCWCGGRRPLLSCIQLSAHCVLSIQTLRVPHPFTPPAGSTADEFQQTVPFTVRVLTKPSWRPGHPAAR